MLMQIDINIILASFIGFKYFKNNIDKLAMSLLKYIINSLHVNNTVRLVLLITIAYNKRYNPIIFNIVLSLPTYLLKYYHSLVVFLYLSDNN